MTSTEDDAGTAPPPVPFSSDDPRSSAGPLGGDATAVEAMPLRRRARRRSPWRSVVEYAGLIIAALVLASLIRAFLGLAFWIPSESMYPTLKVHDRVVVSRLSYRLHDVRRGDIIVFENPEFEGRRRYNLPEQLGRNVLEVMGLGQPEDKNLIKRVIGLPGETLEGKDGAVYVNGTRLAEKWLPVGVDMGPGFEPQTIPSGHVWVMGDNRNNSKDSRFLTDPPDPATGATGAPHPFIAEDKIVGRAFVRIWPFSRIGGL